ncbi:hypothetical protein BGX38DRAFT_1138648 [Terfezia claveryi]|nr:hypothetical protein BGX38DRAFT_1138648 [Terfezia claveryi]
MDMLDWSPDFCLSCDRQSVNGEAYCSQSCRLADLERASGGSSAASSPHTSPTSWTTPTPQGNGFYLPPALNFSTMSSRQASSASSSPRGSISSSSTPPPAVYQPVQHQTRSRYTPANCSQNGQTSTLYPSPSRTSLSSMQSTSQQDSGYLSDKARNELRDYASSFDLVRDWKRRMTIV